MSSKRVLKLEISEQNLVKNMVYSFSERTTVLKELLQNGRRAGATRIDLNIDLDTKIISVRDNGSGIKDMQDLLKIANSGWDQKIKNEESAFGMGWISCLFSCDEVYVASNDTFMEFKTKDVLDFKGVSEGVLLESMTGTFVELRGCENTLKGKNKYQVDRIVSDICEGFPVDVYFNGVLQESKYSIKNDLNFKSTDIGSIGIYGDISEINDFRGHGFNYEAYLQGFSIARSVTQGSDFLVIHLDQNKFKGTMPDRNTLHNATESAKVIQDAINSFFKEQIVLEKEKMSEGSWLTKYWELFEQVGLVHLRNESDLVPVAEFKKWVGDSNDHIIADANIDALLEDCMPSDFPEGMVKDGCVSKSEIIKHKIKFIEKPSFSQYSNFGLCELICNKLNLKLINTCVLGGHWLIDNFVIDLDVIVNEDNIEVESINEKTNGNYGGTHLNTTCEVKLAEGFKITLLPGSVNEIEFISLESFCIVDENGDWAQLFVNPNASYSFLMHQVCEYSDEYDGHKEQWEDEEHNDFEIYIDSLNGAKLTDIVTRILEKVRYDLINNPALASQCFILNFNEKGMFQVEEKLAA